MASNLRSLYYASADNPLPDVRVQHAMYRAVADQSIALSTATTQTYDTTVTQTSHISQAAGVVTVEEPGVYLITFELFWQGNAVGTRQSWLEIGSEAGAFRYAQTTFNALGTADATSGSVVLSLVAGDTVFVRVFHNSNIALNLEGGNREITVTKLGNAAV